MAENNQEFAPSSGSNPSEKALIVRLSIDNKPTEINLARVRDLFSDVNQFNEQFSMGSMMARMILGHARIEEDKVGDSSRTENLKGEEEHQQMSASAMNVIHGDVLNTIGLSLEPVSGKHATIMTGDEKAGEGEMRINVSSRDRFLSFLGALTPENLEESGLKSDLGELPNILAQQVLDHYDLKNPGDEVLQLFGSQGKRIVEEFKRLGMGESVARLERYQDHASQGDLREFIAIQNRSLLAEPGKFFGPADWQTDTTPQGLEQRWGEAIVILEKAKTNPKAQKLSEQLQVHLMSCIRIARGSVGDLDYLSAERKAEFEKILERVELRLTDMMSSSGSSE